MNFNRSWLWSILLLNVAVLIVNIVVFTTINTNSREESGKVISERNYSQTNKLFAFYNFNLSVDDKESLWSDALSKELNGIREKRIAAGRIDILTDNLAIEVEKVPKWHEGIGQALHYGLYANRLPTLAIVTTDNKKDKKTLDVIQAVCDKYNIELILLTPN